MPNLTDYTQDNHNANRGTDRGQQELTKSVQRLGLGRSILTDKEGRIIAGNKTYETATKNGIAKVIEVETDGDTLVVVKRTDLDLDKHIKARELAYADNKIAQDNLDWDLDVLKTDLAVLKSDFLDDLFSNPIENVDFFTQREYTEQVPENFSEYSDSISCDYCCPKCKYEWSGKPK